MNVQQIIDELVELAGNEDTEEIRVMLNVAGRWTGIKGIEFDAEETGLILIESED